MKARAAAETAGVSNFTDFRCMDLNDLNLEGADIIVIFLLPAAISGLKGRLVQYLHDNPSA